MPDVAEEVIEPSTVDDAGYVSERSWLRPDAGAAIQTRLDRWAGEPSAGGLPTVGITAGEAASVVPVRGHRRSVGMERSWVMAGNGVA